MAVLEGMTVFGDEALRPTRLPGTESGFDPRTSCVASSELLTFAQPFSASVRRGH